MAELKRALAGLQARVRLLAFLDALLLALVAALTWAITLLAVSRFTPLLHLTSWLWAGSTLLTVAVLSLAHLKRPSLTEAALVADQHGYNELFSTALQFAEVDQPLVNQQRAQALAAAQAATWAKVIPWRWPKATLTAVASQLVVLTLLLLLPNPQAPRVAQLRLEQTVIDEQRATLEEVIEEVKEPLAQTELGQDLLTELAQLLQELAKAEGAQLAMGEVAELQHRLEQFRLPADLPNRLADLAASLGDSPLAQLVQEALAQTDPAALAEALQGLQAEADQLSESEQAALAELTQLAAGLGLGATGQASLEQLLGQLGNLQNALAAAANGQHLPPQVAGGGDGQGSNPGAGQGDGTGDGQGAGQGDGDGQGGQGQGDGPGQGQGAGQGAGVGQGDGGAGAPGEGNGSTPGNQAGGESSGEAALKPHETIWDPSHLGGQGQIDPVSGRPLDAAGNPIEITGGPLAAGALRPYQEVFGQYQGEAMRGLERSDLPPQWQELVRQYFSAVGGD